MLEVKVTSSYLIMFFTCWSSISQLGQVAGRLGSIESNLGIVSNLKHNGCLFHVYVGLVSLPDLIFSNKLDSLSEELLWGIVPVQIVPRPETNILSSDIIVPTEIIIRCI